MASEPRKPVSLSLSLWKALKARQNQEFEKTGVERSYNDMIEEAWAAYLAAEAPSATSHDPPPAPRGYDPAHAHWHELLESILSRPGESEALQVILDKFAATHRHPARKRAAGCWRVVRRDGSSKHYRQSGCPPDPGLRTTGGPSETPLVE